MFCCYLAGPIDFDKKESNWKDDVKQRCKAKRNLLLFDPDIYIFNNVTSSISKFIYELNCHAIELSDVLMIRLMKDQASVGTPIEIHYAAKLDKKLILITDMLFDSVYINYYANLPQCISAKSVEEGCDVLFELIKDSGKVTKGRWDG